MLVDFDKTLPVTRPGDQTFRKGPFWRGRSEMVSLLGDLSWDITDNLGVFINTVITFVIIALSVLLLIKGVNKMKAGGSAPATGFQRMSLLPEQHTCQMQAAAAHCTSELAQPQTFRAYRSAP